MKNDIRDARELKGLRSQLKALEGEAQAMKVDIAIRQKEYSQKCNAINDLKVQIEKIKNDGKIKLSEHAVLRYLERVRGIDIGEIEKEILNRNLIDLVKKLGGNGTFPGKGYSIIMQNYMITTVIGKENI